MSVVSVESMAFLAPGPKAAERAQPPGSRRPGGVEATGASPGTVPSWPDRPGGRGAPVGGPAGRSGVWGGVGPGIGGCDFLDPLYISRVRDGLLRYGVEALATTVFSADAPVRCCPFFSLLLEQEMPGKAGDRDCMPARGSPIPWHAPPAGSMTARPSPQAVL